MILLTTNNKAHSLDIAPDMPLLWAIRNIFNLAASKFVCGMAQCSPCTVQVDPHATELPESMQWWPGVDSTHMEFSVKTFIEELLTSSSQRFYQLPLQLNA